MTELFCICCIVILAFQVAVTVVRWLMERFEQSDRVVPLFLLGTLCSAVVLCLKLPPVHDALIEALKPLVVEQDFTPIIYLLDVVVITTMFRMLYEHFILHLRYKKWEFVLFGAVFLFFTGWTLLVIP